MILVTGATGTVGSAVVRELLEQGHTPVRAMYRSEADRAKVPGGAEPVRGDFADPASLSKALAGIEAAYLVCSPVADLVQLETNFLQASRDAQLSHLVLNSALGAGDFDKSFPSWHRRVEDKARELRLPCAILRPNGFMQNIVSYFAPTIRSQDAFYGTIGSASISLIDVRDVAAAAGSALSSKDTEGKVFELSGSQAISYESLAVKISSVAGRTIRYVNLSPEQMREGMMAAGMPAAQATSVVELDDYYRTGKGVASDQSLRQLIGRAPRTIDQFLSEVSSQFDRSTGT